MGTFGYSSTAPKPVKEACLLISEYLFKRKDAILGVIGTGEFTQYIRTSGIAKDIMVLLLPYVKLSVGAV